MPGPSALSGLRLMGTLAWPWWHFLGLEDMVPPRSPRTTWWQSGGGRGASLALRCPSLRIQRTIPRWVGPHKDPAGESLASHGGGSLPHVRILTEALGDSGWGSWFLPPRTCGNEGGGGGELADSPAQDTGSGLRLGAGHLCRLAPHTCPAPSAWDGRPAVTELRTRSRDTRSTYKVSCVSVH